MRNGGLFTIIFSIALLLGVETKNDEVAISLASSVLREGDTTISRLAELMTRFDRATCRPGSKTMNLTIATLGGSISKKGGEKTSLYISHEFEPRPVKSMVAPTFWVRGQQG